MRYIPFKARLSLSVLAPVILVVLLGFAPASGVLASSSVLQARDRPWLPGVNLAGGEFAKNGYVRGKDYRYPTPSETNYYIDKGFRVIRIPFLAKRVVKRSSDGKLELSEDFAALTNIIAHAAKRNVFVILDMHDYGRSYSKGLIGRDQHATEEFAATWAIVAQKVKDKTNVIFGLMNEPHKQSADEWLTSANAGIDAIRSVGAKQMILVPGSHWTGAHSWYKSDNHAIMQGVVDPGRNFAYEVHQYLDQGARGTKPTVVDGAGSERLRDFTDWARQKGAVAFLGEFGWAYSDEGQREGDALLSFMSKNRDVWIGWAYWAGGPLWGDYMFSVEPKKGEDRPQMRVLEKFIK